MSARTSLLRSILSASVLLCVACEEPPSATPIHPRLAQVLAARLSLVDVRDDGALLLARSSDASEQLIVGDLAEGVQLHVGTHALRVHESSAVGEVVARAGALTHSRDGGQSWWMTGDEQGFEEWLEIDAGRAYADRAVTRWTVDGHSLREVVETGGAHVVDENGQPIAYVTPPSAWTADGTRVPARFAVHDGVLDLFVDAGGAAVVVDPTWMSTGSLALARAGFYQGQGMVPVPGGALIAGGERSGGSTIFTAERYSSATGTWSSAGSMANPREHHTMTVLADGRVLVVAGYAAGVRPWAEIYDPTANTWSSTGSLATARQQHSATLLMDGRVLVAGGYGSSPLSSAEIYDPATGRWTTTGSLVTARYGHTATILGDGRVLLIGGHDASAAIAACETFDPTSGTWTATAPMSTPRNEHTSTFLPDGRILVVGGRTVGAVDLSSAEIFDSATDTWSATGSTPVTYALHVAALLPTGRVLIAGGRYPFTAQADSATWDPTSGTFTAGPSMATARVQFPAVTLATGRVLVAGGLLGGPTYLTSSELFGDLCGNGTIDAGEQCDPPSLCCSATCRFTPSGSVCRPMAGPCDETETCSGSSASCPADAVSTSTTICRPGAGACDAAEHCDGATVTCPADGLTASGSVCRPAAGACDVAETCDGAASECPADLLAAASTTCRASSASCDPAESCDGVAAVCPADVTTCAPSDAATPDAGSTPIDAGSVVVDAGVDGGARDAGTSASDAAAMVDAAIDVPPVSGGCACSAAVPHQTTFGGLGVTAALAFVARRRRASISRTGGSR